MTNSIISVYRDSGAREDWQPLFQVLADLPDNFDDDDLNRKLVAYLENAGLDTRDAGEYYVWVTGVDTIDTGKPLADALGEAFAAQLKESGYLD